ncbi:Putative Flp pilus-assembly TadE/G-like [Brevibacterium sp. Mu109]|uniref:pilus assembly protein TadG-related protein n=1 Tax=Brevibacterium sp. Mu109 TaxID=1255669 RepID=UPI000C36B5DE|nr:pilus assembly protein TadG-related protein [Brevibacterium sp. Mu109]SMX95237.1 Putative Flp pilus-assembly TadE/G-like [Brevibacterium sp. Mu109]
MIPAWFRTACRRARRDRDERGVAAVWLLIIAATAFVALVGLVGGGGELTNYQVEARRAAEQAARAGADELSEAAIRSGTDEVNTGAAIARARTVLTTSGWTGTVQVRGSTVIVTATGTRKPTFLPLLYVKTVHINETGTATAISSPDG